MKQPWVYMCSPSRSPLPPPSSPEGSCFLEEHVLQQDQFCSVTQWCLTLTLLKLMSIDSVMPSNHIFLCYPLLLPPSIFPSSRVFSNESVLCIRCPKYWSSSFSISHSNEYSGLISFRIYWLDLLEVQGTLKSLLQHHSSKASILQGLAFFIVQLSHPHMTPGKSIVLIRWPLLAK